MNCRSTPDLSIIIPTYNESATLPMLLESLAGQRGLEFELIIADGGSDDATQSLVRTYAATAPFSVSLVESIAGRGRQLNAGAARATGRSLLFLHADSCFADSHALADGLNFLDHTIDRRGDDAVAGHFALCFVCSEIGTSKGYAFYESKARLNRCGCIHGDQGFLVRRDFFEQIGSFDAELPILEDERFADTVFKSGEWVLLPAVIQTSARRFEAEGLLQRQILNALIMNAVAIGWTRFLQQAPGLYRRQGDAGRLDLLPFFLHLRRLFKAMSWKERLQTWYRSGTYVRDNGWQLFFAVDVWQGLRRNSACRGEQTPFLARCEPWFDRFTDHPGGRLLTAGIIWIWFYVTLILLVLSKQVMSIFHRKKEG